MRSLGRWTNAYASRLLMKSAFNSATQGWLSCACVPKSVDVQYAHWCHLVSIWSRSDEKVRWLWANPAHTTWPLRVELSRRKEISNPLTMCPISCNLSPLQRISLNTNTSTNISISTTRILILIRTKDSKSRMTRRIVRRVVNAATIDPTLPRITQKWPKFKTTKFTEFRGKTGGRPIRIRFSPCSHLKICWLRSL